MGVGPQTLRYLLLAEARREHIKTSYLQNPGPSGYSDHEPFGRDQISRPGSSGATTLSTTRLPTRAATL